MQHRTPVLMTRSRSVIARFVVLVCSALIASVTTAVASVIVTKDPAAIAAFKAGRTVLTFDELVVPPGPCYVPLDPNTYAAQGIIITANGANQTNLATLPGCGDFGSTLTPPNIIGGGTGPGSLLWRSPIRFDFPTPVSAFGANSDWTGSNTTLTAYHSDGSVIASATGDQGDFMGIEAPGIAYATWVWNYDQSVEGFSLDNVTFSTVPTGVRDPVTTPPIPTVAVLPNPFQDQTTVRFTLPYSARVRIGIYDVNGHRVASLLDALRPAGEGMVRWNARDERGRAVVSGVYFVRVDVPGSTISRRMVRLR